MFLFDVHILHVMITWRYSIFHNRCDMSVSMIENTMKAVNTLSVMMTHKASQQLMHNNEEHNAMKRRARRRQRQRAATAAAASVPRHS